MSNIIRKRWTPDSSDIKTWTEEKDNGEEYHYARVPVSSTSEDRDGDEFSDKGLSSMQSQYAGKSVNLFPDHGASEDKHARYPWKDIMGRWENAQIDGENTLLADVRFNRENEDADLLRRYLEEDMAVGFSVGFRAIDADGDRKDGFTFHDVDLLETSAVGIPSNPDGVAAMSAESDEWREQLDKQLNMSDNDDNQDDLRDLIKELREDVNELKGAQPSDSDDVDENEETKDGEEPLTKQDLLEILEAKEDDGDSEDDDDDDEDDEDDDSDEDDKSFTISAESKSQVEALEKAFEDCEKDDNGTIQLGESKTVTVAEQSDENDDSDDTPDWGL